MKLAITFHDNDFTMTWISVLNVFLDAYRWNGKLPFTKEQFISSINEISLGCYIINQNQYEYRNTNEDYYNIKEYLKVSEKHVHIYEEVDNYILTLNGNGDNGETFILDTDLDYKGSHPIYSLLMSHTDIRPPLGLMPRELYESMYFITITIEQRKRYIKDAINRYNKVNKQIPIEWKDELDELIYSTEPLIYI